MDEPDRVGRNLQRDVLVLGVVFVELTDGGFDGLDRRQFVRGPGVWNTVDSSAGSPL